MITKRTYRKYNEITNPANYKYDLKHIVRVKGVPYKIFIQPQSKVKLVNGSYSDLAIAISTNPEYPDPIFFLCGRDFLDLPHKEQMAIAYIMLRFYDPDYCDTIIYYCGGDPYNMGVRSFQDVHDDELNVMDTIIASLYREMSVLFGEPSARRYLKKFVNNTLKSNRFAAKVEANKSEKEGTMYNRECKPGSDEKKHNITAYKDAKKAASGKSNKSKKVKVNSNALTAEAETLTNDNSPFNVDPLIVEANDIQDISIDDVQKLGKKIIKEANDAATDTKDRTEEGTETDACNEEPVTVSVNVTGESTGSSDDGEDPGETIAKFFAGFNHN